MKERIRKLIQKAVKVAAEKIKPQKVILFGSYAYGRPNKDSDIDLLFIKNTTLSRMERSCLIDDHLDHFMAMDIIVKTPSEIRKRLNMGDPFYHEIMKKGKVIFNAAK